MSFFLPPAADEWIGYQHLRDSPAEARLRDRLERYWAVWKDNADPHFQRECRQGQDKFNQRFWEMYLGCRLLGENIKVESSAAGPDLRVNLNGRRVWIEAICPTRGEVGSPNRVPDLLENAAVLDEQTGDLLQPFGDGQVGSVEARPIQLRYLSAIKNKYSMNNEKGRKHSGLLRYINDGIVAHDDPYIVAVNAANIKIDCPSPDLPLIVKSCFGIGGLSVLLRHDDRTHAFEYAGTKHGRRDFVTKVMSERKPEVEVRSDIFLNISYPYISAILFSYMSFCQEFIDEEIILINNPFALNPLKVGTLPIAVEYRVEDERYDDERTRITEGNLVRYDARTPSSIRE